MTFTKSVHAMLRHFNFEPSLDCNGVVVEIYEDHKFQRPQEGLNCEYLAYEVSNFKRVFTIFDVNV